MVAFVDLLLDGTTHPLYITSLTNERVLGGEKHISTRDKKRIAEFVKKYDVSGRAVYYCVSTIPSKQRRNKENAAESKIVFVDIDYKDILAPEDALAIVKKLPVPPNRIHLTGHGLHALWFLKAPVIGGPGITSVVRKLCRVLGGDPHVCHAAALLRWPGSHNSKDPKDIKTVKSITVAKGAYDLEVIEKWLDTQDVVIHRKDRATDPYREFIDQMAGGTPIDVDLRLKEMEFQGSGDKAIHRTQVSCSASLLSRGVDPEEVIETIYEATEEAADRAGLVFNPPWNSDQEHLKIEKMVASWEHKHKDEILEARAARAKPNGSKGGDNIVAFGPVLAAKELKKAKADKNFHLVIVSKFLELLEPERIAYNTGMLWRYRDGMWLNLDDKEEKDWVNRKLTAATQHLKVNVKRSVINEAWFAVHNSPQLYVEHIDWDAHGKIPTLSGLVDPDTLKVRSLEPNDYATYRIQCVFDPKAKCPWWEKILEADFAGDKKTIASLQEWLGAALIENKPKELMKALILVGPSNSGKSNLLNALAYFISDRLITTPFKTLSNNPHGLEAFLQRRPWLLHEAFEAGEWHPSADVKALLSGDPIGINPKNKPLQEHRYKSPVLWGANTSPQFKDASKAMRNRVIIQPCDVVFDEDNPTGAAIEARKRGLSGPAELVLHPDFGERSGILNWALEGWRRLKKRGYFEYTDQQKAELRDMELRANDVKGMIEDVIEFDPLKMMWKGDFFRVHAYWWLEKFDEGRRMPSNDQIGRVLKDLHDKRMSFGKSGSHRYIVGIKFNDLGKMLWEHAGALEKTKHSTKLIGCSNLLDEVEKDRPLETP